MLTRSEVNAYEYFKDILNPVNVDLNIWHQRNARVAIRTDEQLDCERPNMYTCEEPPNLVHPDAPKTCSYRNVRYHEQVFRWVAGRGCLMFTPDFLFNAGFNNISLNAGCFYENLFAPCVELPKEDGTCGCYPFDPGSEEVAQLVREAIVPSAHGRWERCYYAASDCCSHDMLSVTNTAQEENCGATFDGWTCWHAAEAGSTAFEVCPEFAYSSGSPSCQHFSSKQCIKNATWELQTDYSTCSITSRLLRRYRFHIVMLSFSIASCLPAVLIFCFYDRLRITRIGFHRNILITIIVRNILVIISKNETLVHTGMLLVTISILRGSIYIDEITNAGDTLISGNGVACRLLSVAERLATNMVFVCMLVEGIFLHRLVVAVFQPQLNINLLYGIGAVLAVFPVSAWAVMMILLDDHSCWLTYTVEGVQWVLDAPRIFILLLNTVLLLDVFRVLLTRIRNSETTYQLSTTKATLFLMTIFGTQFLLTVFRPNTTNCTWEQMYYYVAYTVEGLQGFIVAMLHCYVNKEVHTLLKNTNRKTECAVVPKVRRNSSYPRMSIDSKSERHLTCSTTMPIHIDDQKNQYATIAPKLHVAEIISIQASERLADILEPVYEIIENGACNGGYDSLERSSVDNDSGFIANRDSKGDNHYGFTHVSSVSIDCQDWIKCISSPSSSIYNHSLNDYETRYLERKFPNHPKFKEIVVARKRLSLQDIPWESEEKNKKADEVDKKDVINRSAKGIDMESNYENCENMLEEILQYIETNDDNVKPLNIDLIYPNMNIEQ